MGRDNSPVEFLQFRHNGVNVDNVSTAQGARLTFAPSRVNISLRQ
jgi:hypothetical protein